MGTKFFRRRVFYVLIAGCLLLLTSVILFRLFFQYPHITIPAGFDISTLPKLPTSNKCFQVNFDFESESAPNIKILKRDGQKNPTRVFEFTDTLEYGPTFSSKIKTICETSRIVKLVLGCDVFALRKDLPALVVVSIEHEGKSLYWKFINIPFVDSQWKNINLEFMFPSDVLEPEAELKVYIWNNSRNSFMIDNMHVEFISGGTENQTYGFYPERHVAFDFDTPTEQQFSNVHTDGPSRSGNGSCKLGFFNPFSPVVTQRVGAVADGPMKDVTVRAEVFPTFDNPILNFAVSLSDSSGKEYFFKSRSDSRKYEGGKWTPMKANMDLPAERIKPSDVISVYVWNKGFQNVYIDDFEVQFAESNKRVGVKSIIDMNGYGEGGYDFKSNMPPFRKKTLSAFQITGVYDSSDSTIVDLNDKPINAFDKISGGKFGALGSKQSQLAVLRNQSLLFFGLCNGDSKWRQLARLTVPNIQGLDLMNSKWLVQDVNDDGFEELIVHTKGKNYLYALSPDRNRQTAPCIKGFSGNVSATQLQLDASVSNSSYSLIACNDFVGTRGSEFLFADLLTGNFKLLNASGNLVSNGRSDAFKTPKPQEFIADQVRLFSVNDKKHLAIRADEFSGYRYFKFNESGTVLIEQKVPGSDLIPFLGCDAVMDFPDPKSASFLFHRTVPKFGLFAVSRDPVTGFVIQNEFEFSGYPDQRNPKYYEKRLLFFGDFSGGGKKELLIISSNCGDSSYNGYKCNVPEYSTPFPPVSFIFTLD